jgi:hypothetical protein
LLSVKNSSPRVFFCSRRRNSSPRVFFFAENICFYSRQRDLRRELEIKLSPKNIALGEDSVSRSEARSLYTFIGPKDAKIPLAKMRR